MYIKKIWAVFTIFSGNKSKLQKFMWSVNSFLFVKKNTLYAYTFRHFLFICILFFFYQPDLLV